MGISPIPIAIILILGVLIFGKDLPDVARRVGLAFMELKKGLNEFKDISSKSLSLDEVTSLEREVMEAMETETDRHSTTGTKFEPPSV